MLIFIVHFFADFFYLITHYWHIFLHGLERYSYNSCFKMLAPEFQDLGHGEVGLNGCLFSFLKWFIFPFFFFFFGIRVTLFYFFICLIILDCVLDTVDGKL